MRGWLKTLKGLRRYPSLVAGLVIVMTFVMVSIYAVIAIPYSEAIRLWQGGPGVWDENPKHARPVWFDYFTRDRLPRTIRVEGVALSEDPVGETVKRVEIVFPFEFNYDRFPREVSLVTVSSAVARMTAFWEMPDGRTIEVCDERSVRRGTDTYYISQDEGLRSRLGATLPHRGLFMDTDGESLLRGEYRLVLVAEIPEEAELDGRLIVYGEVEGLAGTDHRRRDLMVSLLWGAPIGLIFGVVAAVGAQLSTFVLAGISTWFGGKVERIFMWLTQVNLVIPVLPILIMIGYFYTRSLWVMLGLVIALNIFSASMITYRAMFMQLKESPYIEAAQSYGAGNLRIIFRYLLPKIAPTLLPQFVLVIPTFVFLEATLAVLGLGDPKLPTWGKLLNDAYSQGALYRGHYYWVLQPAILLMMIGIGFALVGFSLDRIFNPRLRTV